MNILVFGDDSARMEAIGEALRREGHFISYRTAQGWCGEVEVCDRVIFVNATARLEMAYRQTSAEILFDDGVAAAPPRPQGERPESAQARKAAEGVEIPQDWERLPFFSKKKLAQQITGGAINNGQQADAAIREELSKRAARA